MAINGKVNEYNGMCVQRQRKCINKEYIMHYYEKEGNRENGEHGQETRVILHTKYGHYVSELHSVYLASFSACHVCLTKLFQHIQLYCASLPALFQADLIFFIVH